MTSPSRLVFPGQLDVLVNNAGRSQRAAFQTIDINVDRELFDVNVFGMVSLSRLVLSYFLDHQIRGQFVVTSSTAGSYFRTFVLFTLHSVFYTQVYMQKV